MESSSNIRQVIVVRKDLNMRKGKLAAQVAHASNEFLVELYNHAEAFIKTDEYKEIRNTFNKWYYDNLFTKIVLGINSERELLDLIEKAKSLKIKNYPIYDMGLTEFHGVKTLTCCSFGPGSKEELDKVTGHLQLI